MFLHFFFIFLLLFLISVHCFFLISFSDFFIVFFHLLEFMCFIFLFLFFFFYSFLFFQVFLFFPFVSLFVHLFFLFFQLSEQTPKLEKNHRQIPPPVKKKSFVTNRFLGLGGRGEGEVRNGQFEGDFAFMHFIYFSFLPFVFLRKTSFFFFFLIFLSKMFRCWHQYQSSTVDVSSVMEMWCPEKIGRDSWGQVGSPSEERA